MAKNVFSSARFDFFDGDGLALQNELVVLYIKGGEIFKFLLTFNVDLELFRLYLEAVGGAGADLADPDAGVPQAQVGHLDGAVVVGVGASPCDPAPLDVDALAHDVRVEVGRLPPAEVDLAVGGAVQNDVVADLLDGHLSGAGVARVGGAGVAPSAGVGLGAEPRSS